MYDRVYPEIVALKNLANVVESEPPNKPEIITNIECMVRGSAKFYVPKLIVTIIFVTGMKIEMSPCKLPLFRILPPSLAGSNIMHRGG